jgi:transcriptional regulator with XRE-family HTH domain
VLKLALVHIGERLRDYRKRIGWSQDELADASGIPQTVISAIETGKTSDPGYLTVTLLATTMRMNFADLALGAIVDTMLEPTQPDPQLSLEERVAILEKDRTELRKQLKTALKSGREALALARKLQADQELDRTQGAAS